MEEAIRDMALLSAFLKRIWWDSHRYFEMVSRFDIFMFFLLLLPVGIQLYVNIPLKSYIDQKEIESSLNWFNLEIENLYKKIADLSQEIEKLKKHEV